MDDLKISVLQISLTWEDPIANRLKIDEWISRVEESDVIVLPEMFTTGFSMSPERVAEQHDAATMITLNEMRLWAKKSDAVVTGSISVKDGDHFYNRLYWVLPDGSFSMYDKRHTFGFAKEDEHYASGHERIIKHWRGWNICPLICYDLRFPVWSRNGLDKETPQYDVLIYVANWPSVRREPWRKLLYARAIENQAYVIACNRVGEDANGNNYSGDSAIINPRGEMLLEGKEYVEEMMTATLSKKEHEDFREKFPVLKDADLFKLV
jgi:omega-amidase